MSPKFLPRIFFGCSFLCFLILISLLSPLLPWFSQDHHELSLRLAAPSLAHPLGCDLHGGDLLKGIIWGARISLYVAFLSVLFTFSIGLILGLVAGYFGGFYDAVIMRVVDILMAFPGILLAMSISALIGPSIHTVIFAIAATGWTSTARLVRGQVLTLREREFVLAAKAIGANFFRILYHHIFPQLWAPILVSATFSLSGVILIEASLSFLGLGSQSEHPSWGGLLSQGRGVLLEAPHLSIIPGLMIATTVLAINFLGDALRDRLDPRN